MTRGAWFTASAVRVSRAMGDALVSEKVARQRGLLQSFDPRVRLAGVVSLVIAAIVIHSIAVLVMLLALAAVLGPLSRVSLVTLAKRVWLVVLVFTSVIALPALFLTPGVPLSEYSSWGSKITHQGLTSATLLLLRVETTATLTTLLVLTMPWMHLLKALRAFRVPQEVVMMLAMTHRYVFLLAETAGQMFESRQSRTVGVLRRGDRRRVTAQTAGVLLSKSVELSSEVYLAMQSRGFRGEAKVLNEFRFRGSDYLALSAFLVAALLAAWMGRA